MGERSPSVRQKRIRRGGVQFQALGGGGDKSRGGHTGGKAGKGVSEAKNG